ncbi:peptidoglycan-binding domain-containing protein [Flindersiella endophytica]
MSGDDVAHLHTMLDAIGVEVDDDERARQHFGASTREAVTRIQLVLGLAPTGEVDPHLLELAGAAGERLIQGDAFGEDRYVIQGPVTDGDGMPLRGCWSSPIA